MSVSIDLPCGCTLNAAFVLSMCLPHAQELRAKELEARREYERFEMMMRDTDATPHKCNYE